MDRNHTMPLPPGLLPRKKIVYAPEDEGVYGDCSGGFDMCKICFEKEKEVTLPCGHLLCKGCSEQILKVKPQCPFCRAEARGSVRIQIAGGALKAYKDQPWCAAGLEKNDVRASLWKMKAGSFFVRESSSQRETYSLDVKKPEGGIYSFRINQVGDRWLFALQPLNPDISDDPSAKPGYESLAACIENFPHPKYRLLYPGGHDISP